jgi:hypothetical protein
MPEQSSVAEGTDQGRLERSASQLARARRRLSAGRGARISRNEELQLRAELHEALESYADLLAENGLPVPYRIRDELSLFRLIADRG